MSDCNRSASIGDCEEEGDAIGGVEQYSIFSLDLEWQVSNKRNSQRPWDPYNRSYKIIVDIYDSIVR